MNGNILHNDDDANRLLHRQQSLGMAGVGPSPTVWKQYLERQQHTKKRNAETAELGNQDSHLYSHRIVSFGSSQLVSPHMGRDHNIIGGNQDPDEDELSEVDALGAPKSPGGHQAQLDRMSHALHLGSTKTTPPANKGRTTKKATKPPSGVLFFYFFSCPWQQLFLSDDDIYTPHRAHRALWILLGEQWIASRRRRRWTDRVSQGIPAFQRASSSPDHRRMIT